MDPFAILSLVSSLVLFGWAFLEFRKGNSENLYLPTEATIISSKMDQEPLWTILKGTKNFHSVEVSYQYEVDGLQYQSDSLRSEKIHVTGSYAATLCRKYSVGSKHTAYYNPKDPNVAVIEKENKLKIYVLLLLGLLSISMTLVLWFK